MSTLDFNTTGNIDGSDRVGRRRILAGAACLALAPPSALAISPFVAVVLPTVLAGLLSLLGVRWQLRQEEARHQHEAAMSVANLRIAQAQLWQQETSQRQQDRYQALQLLLNHSEEARRRFELTHLHLVESVAIDRTGSGSNLVLSGNADGAGTRMGLVNGRLAAERNGAGSYLDNQFAFDLGVHSHMAGDPLPVAVSGLIRDMDKSLSRHLMSRAAQAWNTDEKAVDEHYSLAGYRMYSRASHPKGQPDLRAVMLLPKRSGAAMQYAYV
jgi:hypothetical protein